MVPISRRVGVTYHQKMINEFSIALGLCGSATYLLTCPRNKSTLKISLHDLPSIRDLKTLLEYRCIVENVLRELFLLSLTSYEHSLALFTFLSGSKLFTLFPKWTLASLTSSELIFAFLTFSQCTLAFL